MPKKPTHDDWSSGEEEWRSEDEFLDEVRPDIDYSERELDNLMYDPEADELDEKWAEKQREGRSSDAILSCPGCLTTVSIDCQQHASYHNQFRAMFAMNVKVDTSEILKPAGARGPSGPGGFNHKGRKGKGKSKAARHFSPPDPRSSAELELHELQPEVEVPEAGPSPSASPSSGGGVAAFVQQRQSRVENVPLRVQNHPAGPSETPKSPAGPPRKAEPLPPTADEALKPPAFTPPPSPLNTATAAQLPGAGPGSGLGTAEGPAAAEERYHPVTCTVCGTEIGVVDAEDVFHFFNVVWTAA